MDDLLLSQVDLSTGPEKLAPSHLWSTDEKML